MPDKLDLDGLGRFVERVLGRARSQSRLWVGAWLACILVVTTVVALFRAPTAAYVILAVVVVVVVQTGDRVDGP